ncbi:hypothetical protein [Haloterrigena alkaliphila]|uniref:Uncharacterized protein n=1 Tax=Haloterrigena alkaliphila TaxID=2816475 RepID=A0A8A2VJU6_9EURY|nr:hypothetical protein [Haloterrigena alkaliphila]QSX00888.1 hypothetical protein J0X25_07995 [Haloterrigena alkaliphila]
MDNKWLEDEDYYEALRRIVRETARGGVEIQDELPTNLTEIYEEGVDEEIIKKDELFDCPNCERTYSFDYSRDVCDCGYPVGNKAEFTPHTVQYYHDIYPSFIKNRIGDEIGEFEIVYRDDRIEDIPAADLHPTDTSNKNFIHISPYFHSEVGMVPFPGYSDIFLSWSKVRELIVKPGETIEILSDYLESEEGNDDQLIGDGGVIFDSGVSATDFRNLSDRPWFTMQRDTSPEIANRRSRETFKMEYYDLFEHLGMEFLHTMFPHAIQLEGGKQGKPEPDGYLHVNKRNSKQTYLVESKCYSRDFKIFSEIDKNKRYIERFVSDIEPETDYNLVGCIFIATRFNQDRTRKDIGEMVSRNIEERNLDVICINDQMMGQAVEQLRELYRLEPSSNFRIYKNSSFYRDLLDGLSQFSRQHGVDNEAFESMILDKMTKAGKKEINRERTLREGFDHSVGYESFCERIAG